MKQTSNHSFFLPEPFVKKKRALYNEINLSGLFSYSVMWLKLQILICVVTFVGMQLFPRRKVRMNFFIYRRLAFYFKYTKSYYDNYNNIDYRYRFKMSVS